MSTSQSDRLDRIEAQSEQALVERQELREFFLATMQTFAEMSEQHEARMAQNEARMAQNEARIAQNEARMSRMQDNMDRMNANHEQQMARLHEGILASQVLQGLLSEQTLQLKQTVDYLLSQDGGDRPNPQSEID